MIKRRLSSSSPASAARKPTQAKRKRATQSGAAARPDSREASSADVGDDSPRERVVDGLLRGLYDGRYSAGQRLIEAQLTSTYRTSRGSVREALNRLAAMGVVSLVSQRGALVRSLTLGDAIGMMMIAQSLTQIGVRLAAMNIGKPGAAEQIVRALERVEAFDASSPSVDYARARSDFYSVITEVSGNSELKRIMPRLRIHLVRVQFRSVTSVLDQRRHEGYRQIAEAILSGNSTKAQAVVKLQFGRTIKRLREVASTTSH